MSQMGRVFLTIQEIENKIVRPTEALATPHGRSALNYLAAQRKKKKMLAEAETKPRVNDQNCWQGRKDCGHE